MTTHDARWEPERELPEGAIVATTKSTLAGYTDFGTRTITLSDSLTPEERRTVLGHEVVHLERGPMPADPLLYLLEEMRVDEDSTRRLIGLDDLLGAVQHTTQPELLAKHLGVSHAGLFTRLERLTDDERSQLIDVVKRKENYEEDNRRAHRRSHR